MKRKILTSLVLLSFLIVALSAVPVQAQSIIATIPVGEFPGEIAVDPNTNRVYVVTSEDCTVTVIDGSTNGIITVIPVGPDDHHLWGIDVNLNTNRIYVAYGEGLSVAVIDSSTNTVVTTIPIGGPPRGVAVNPNTNRIYVADTHNNLAVVIDGSTNGIITPIAVGPSPYGVALNPNTNRIYVTSEGDDTVSVIDGSTNTVIDTIAVGDLPEGIAVNTVTNRIYVTNVLDGTVSVIDGSTNGVITTIPVGGFPYGVGVKPNTNRIYVTYESVPGMVSVIDGFANSIITTLEVEKYPYGVGVNSATNRIYVANSVSNTVSVILDSLALAIESCDSTGTKKDTFQPNDEVYATGTGYSADTTYDMYLVEDVTWVDGMAIPAWVPGTTTSISSDASGNVPATLLWSSFLVPGKYDIVVDVDGDGLYYAEADALDDNDIEVTAGFFVIPEPSVIIATLFMFGALATVYLTRKRRLNNK